ncbi:diguanylate cyclase [Marinobacterium sediminicola]|uniref:Diguanylate cyclase n=1 Tax=Marinobacterium sediminicola TaxID=518898 RepID=A0ABY1S1P5_9GAMM|nr:diguanylate cyclase [Marinobacterium sediminicola]
MPRISSEHLCSEWSSINLRFSPDIRQLAIDFAREHSASLSEHFYREMLSDPGASQFLSNDEVQSRLGVGAKEVVHAG